MTQPDDERALVRAMCDGQEAAFDRFFREYAPRVYRFVLTRVGRDPQVAEELTQDVLSRAMRKIASWRGDAALFTWLCQLARNQVVDHWRRRQRRGHVEVSLDESAADALAEQAADASLEPEQLGLREDLLYGVQQALDSLPAGYGDALEWKYVEGCSVNEIGERLGLNPVATQSLLARARRSLRIALENAAAAPSGDFLPFTRDVDR